jgi:hypothetical protein
VVPLGSEYLKRDKNPIIWQWFKLHFGQNVLLKRGPNVDSIDEKLLPSTQKTQGSLVDNKIGYLDSQQQKKIPKTESETQKLRQPSLWDNHQYFNNIEKYEITPEKAADIVVKNKFKVNDIGSLLLKLASQENGEEKSMLFAKLIAKARIARIKR